MSLALVLHLIPCIQASKDVAVLCVPHCLLSYFSLTFPLPSYRFNSGNSCLLSEFEKRKEKKRKVIVASILFTVNLCISLCKIVINKF